MSAVQQPVSGRETDAPEPRYLRRIERPRTYQVSLTGWLMLFVLEAREPEPEPEPDTPDCGHLDKYLERIGDDTFCMRCRDEGDDEERAVERELVSDSEGVVR